MFKFFFRSCTGMRLIPRDRIGPFCVIGSLSSFNERSLIRHDPTHDAHWFVIVSAFRTPWWRHVWISFGSWGLVICSKPLLPPFVREMLGPRRHCRRRFFLWQSAPVARDTISQPSLPLITAFLAVARGQHWRRYKKRSLAYHQRTNAVPNPPKA